MPVIHVLDKSVAELIAAGEVVERPASIVKELLENAVDAGATNISVEITGGGTRMIRVADNGCGISREDIPKAFLRHATSKVRSAEDLDGILTLGFRGEALASVAAMCRVELTTKTDDEAESTTYTVEGGRYVDCVPAGRPTGTTITVRDVFFNTPARMKFLKKDISEGNSVAQAVDKCALSHPEIAFRFIRDGITKLKTSGNGDLLSVIYEIYGRDFAGEMIEVDYTYENLVHVGGYISKPGGAKPSRAYQTFFINGRFVKTRTASAALEEAFKNKLMGGKFPACVLNLTLDAATVDVNVHPAKIEVRFENEKPVFSAVYYAVKTTLAKLESPVLSAVSGTTAIKKPTLQPIPERISAREFKSLFMREEKPPPAPPLFSKPVSMRAPSPSLDISVDDGDYFGITTDSTLFAKKTPEPDDIIFDETAINTAILATNKKEAMPKEQPGAPAVLIGEAFGTYILLQTGDELLLVDKHAAHERILYEQLMQDLSCGNRQVLLTPVTVALTKDEHAALLENEEQTQKLGFLVEDFGGGMVIVREVPIELAENDVAYIVREIADKLLQNRHDLTPHVLDRLYYNIACRGAVKAHDKTSPAELNELVRQLNENPAITHCPHGRPVTVRLTKREVEKMFGRLG